MQLQPTSNTQFGARFISSPSVMTKLENGKWMQDKVNFVKLNTSSHSDLKTLKDVITLWGGQNLSKAISEEAHILGKESNVYALTTQVGHFKKLNPKDVLGLITTGDVKTKESSVEVFKVGTDPIFAYEQNRRSRNVKHIAKAMFQEVIGMLHKNDNVKNVNVHIEAGDERFLSRLGFKPYSIDQYALSKDSFEILG